MPKKPPVIQTTTDEPYLPTRLVYTVHRPDDLRRWFERHPSMAWDSDLRRWAWNYHRKLMLGERTFHGTLTPLERHRLELFYADGPQAFETAMRYRELFALLQHKSPTPICPYEVIKEQLEKGFEAPTDPQVGGA